MVHSRVSLKKFYPLFISWGVWRICFFTAGNPEERQNSILNLENNAAVMYIQVKSEGATMILKLQKIILG